MGNVYKNNKNDLYKRRCKTILGTFEEVMTKDEFQKRFEKCSKIEKEKINEINVTKTQANTKKEIHHLRLKSKDGNKSCDRPKTTCSTKNNLKKEINIKLVNTKAEQKENCDNVNQAKAQKV